MAGGGVLRAGDGVAVRLVKAPRPDVRYPAEVMADDGVRVVVRAPWAGAGDRDFGFVVFARGDVFTEYYWRDRWYSVKEVREAGGTLKGWYCDMTRPVVVRDGAIEVTDLELDLWVSADGGTVLRLDEDEYAASGLAARDPEAAGHAERALDGLEALARSGGPAALRTLLSG